MFAVSVEKKSSHPPRSQTFIEGIRIEFAERYRYLRGVSNNNLKFSGNSNPFYAVIVCDFREQAGVTQSKETRNSTVTFLLLSVKLNAFSVDRKGCFFVDCPVC